MHYAAAALFVERARTVRPQLRITPTNAPAVAAICSRLDGLPLAIELAAARSKLFAPAELLARLDKRLSLLTGGPRDLPIRQRTLRDTLAWSHDLLNPAERRLFARLALFVGSADLAAIEAICGEAAAATDPTTFELVEALIDKSLLRQTEDADSTTRFTMLETIREYALEQFEASGEAKMLRQQYTEHYMVLAEQAAPELTGPQQMAWLDRLEREYDNLRAAFGWALGTAQIEIAARIAGALWRFWLVRGRWSEGRQWLESVLPDLASLPASIQIPVLLGASVLAANQSDYARAKPLSEAALTLQRGLGDQHGITLSLNMLGWIFSDQGDYQHALACYEECLEICRSLGDQQGIAVALNNLGNLAQSERDYARADKLFGESLALYRLLDDQLGMARVANNLGMNAYYQGDHAQAMTLYAQGLELFQQLGDQSGTANVLSNMGQVASVQHDFRRAAAYLARSLALFRTLDSRMGIAECLEQLAGVVAAQAQTVRAARLLGAAEALRDAISAPLSTVERVVYDQMVAGCIAQLHRQMTSSITQLHNNTVLDKCRAPVYTLGH